MSGNEDCTPNFRCRKFWPLTLVGWAFLLGGGILAWNSSVPIAVLWFGWGGLIALGWLPNYTVCEEGIRVEVLRFRHLVAWQEIRRIADNTLSIDFMPGNLPRGWWWFGILAGVGFLLYGFRPGFRVSLIDSNFFRMREVLRIRVGEPGRAAQGRREEANRDEYHAKW